MLSTDTIFVLRDRFDGREGRSDADGQAEAERSPSRSGHPGHPGHPGAEPRSERRLADFGQDLQLVRAPAPGTRVRPLMTAVPAGIETEPRNSELGAMKGILLGVAIGASCWAFIGGLIYSFMG